MTSAASDRTGVVGSQRAPVEVLWLTKGLGAGGAEHLLLSAARVHHHGVVHARAGYLLPHKRALVAQIEAAGVPTRCIGSARWWDPRWVLRLRRWLRDEPVDVVHAHAPVAAIGARVVVRSLPRRARPAMATTLHNVWASRHLLTRTLDRLTAGLDDARFSVSQGVMASLPERVGRGVEVVVHGVDVESVRNQRDRDGVRRELGIAQDEILVGTVANLRATKGYPDLLAAARTVVGQAPQVRFVAIGQGPQEPELASLHEDLGLGDRFRFLGHRPDAVRLMSGFDVFCMASHHEGLPIALMEAMAVGLPVVATDVGGIAEIVTPSTEGVLVPARRPGELAAALLGLAADPDRRARFAAAAEATGAGLAIDAAVSQMEHRYRELADR